MASNIWYNIHRCLREPSEGFRCSDTQFSDREGDGLSAQLKVIDFTKYTKGQWNVSSEISVRRTIFEQAKKTVNNTDIPQHQIEAIARYILPDFLAFYESREGWRDFAEWEKQREAEQEK